MELAAAGLREVLTSGIARDDASAGSSAATSRSRGPSRPMLGRVVGSRRAEGVRFVLDEARDDDRSRFCPASRLGGAMPTPRTHAPPVTCRSQTAAVRRALTIVGIPWALSRGTDRRRVLPAFGWRVSLGTGAS